MKSSLYLRILLVMSLSICGLRAEIFYVDRSAPPEGDGTSWATAFNNLDDAVAATTDGIFNGILNRYSQRDEIFVKKNYTYVINNLLNIQRGTRIYGGLKGDETTIEEAILSNQYSTFNGNGQLRMHMDVEIRGLIFDGFNNDANSVSSVYYGDLISFSGGTGTTGVIIGRCKFIDNTVTYSDTASITRLRSDTEITFIDCYFENNQTLFTGSSNSEKLTLINCIFFDNTNAGNTSIISSASNCNAVNCLFVSNLPTYYNNASLFSASPIFVNCTFDEPISYTINDGDIFFNNCIISGLVSHSPYGGDRIYLEGSNFFTQSTNTFSYFGNGTRSTFNPTSTFRNQGFIKGNDRILGTSDDGYRLKISATAINGGQDLLLPLDEYDVDLDGVYNEVIEVDLGGYKRSSDIYYGNPDIDPGSGVDIGAYEFGDELPENSNKFIGLIDNNNNGISDDFESNPDSATLNQLGYYSTNQLQDGRDGSVMIQNTNDQIILQLQVERSTDLSSWTSTSDDLISIPMQIDSDKQFFRFAMPTE